ncbi:MAG: chemotaxis protein CheB [Chloroflexi bacterium]|nr:chemotaxis protein CheB [Chloroflexota bacterium]MBV9896794.1 chemotaxis protein CheB [Chloroflexota bacterium]
MTFSANGHDIVVIGASAGGVEALTHVAAGLPQGFAAAVFIVLHLPPDAPSALAAILARAGRVPAMEAKHQLAIEPGTIYVAPPNRHLAVHRGHMVLQAGPRENSARPAVDVLFRSAARAYGRRVVGIVLSGTLRDGALGLAAIKLRGGVTIVQDPQEALFSGMPQSALRATTIDFRLRAADIASQLVKLTSHSFEHEPMQSSESERFDVTMHAADEPESEASPKLPNAASGLTCPECHGSLWELNDSGSYRFECRTGHAYSLDALLAEQGEAVEAALWAAVNSLQERSATFRRLSETPSTLVNNPDYLERAEQVERQAEALLSLLRGLISDGQVG